MSCLARTFLSLHCSLSHPAPPVAEESLQPGRVMRLPGYCPEAPGVLMTLHEKALITFHSSASSLITQGKPESWGWGMAVSEALRREGERPGQKHVAP